MANLALSVIAFLSIIFCVWGRSAIFSVTQTHSFEYGISLISIITRSLVDCYVQCSSLNTCQSVMYSEDSGQCNINIQTATESDLNCVFCTANPGVTYGEKYTIITTKYPVTSSLGIACINVFNCWGSNMDCRAGICQCLSGYHYDPNTYDCVTACTLYGFSYQSESDVVMGHPYSLNISTSTVDMCKTVCTSETDITCKTANFIADGSICHMFNITGTEGSIAPQSGAILLKRDCEQDESGETP